MKKVIAGILCLLCLFPIGHAYAASSIDALLITGRSNKFHNWQATSAAIEQHLRDAGIFKLSKIVTSPGGESLDNFAPNWSDYDVVILDYEGEEWPSTTKAAFVKYIKNGGGLVLIHASDNSFPNWQEYNEIIGLGGWGGANLHSPPLSTKGTPKGSNRDERWGPRIYFKHGQLVRDHSPGGTFHPPSQDFLATTRNFTHPITKGMPENWLLSKDELYSRLRGPAKNIEVLVTGKANPAIGRTSPYHEPILFTVRYGKGRVVHNTLGHAGARDTAKAESLNSVPFITFVQRGTEWAASGEVTQALPDDFPTAYTKSNRITALSEWTKLLDSDLTDWEIFMGVPDKSVKFNGNTAIDYDKPIGLNNDPKGVFSTHQENGEIILHITGEIFAGLTSKQSFKNYHLQLKMRWGDKKWPPRLNKKRDSGVLYHAHGEHGAFWDVWKSSLEYQVQESDMGDFITLAGPTADVRLSKKENRHVFDLNSQFQTWEGYLHAQVEADRPLGKWNTLDIYVLEDQAIHMVNGRIVMALKNARDKHGNPLTEGQLQIQSEAAEVEYKDIRIRNIDAFPPLLKLRAKL
ncbi:family 16 glycoside hydrolase [Agaribacter flavus]|uniref:Family 16 glycoside hydrolase n=1 Tax=Agaribacter flavus TaxID=1902781 RepID=A0ABV7FNK3_9ALTE